ncbi:hypothetical protein L873DRAFT_1667604 [Choiromyces venosus 120613-1]|uniref:Uncharacterized protein n=1 Tax=Choiromyces venosus 120613-1 TaxID=1336337 RepID=A0A3N4K0T0_9PEZI|nr:hypothetical protein L873DRAFT_1667604 [Choiromyces venosus 120613-1]
MCFGNGRFGKRDASNSVKNPDVNEWLKSIKSEKHGTGPPPPALPACPVIKPEPIGVEETPASSGIAPPTIIIESPDDMRIGFNANGVRDSLSPTLVNTSIEEEDDDKVENVKRIICKLHVIKDEQEEESSDDHLMDVNDPAENSTADTADEKAIVKATEETVESEDKIEIITGNLEVTRSNDLTTHVARGGGEEEKYEKPGSRSFSGFSGDFTRDVESVDGSESSVSTPEISDKQVESTKEVEVTEVTEPTAVESTEAPVVGVFRKGVDIVSLDPGPVFNFSDVGDVEMLDPTLFHDIYTDSIWNEDVVTKSPGILFARSGDYQRYGLEPPEGCIKDEEDTPELTYTADGMAITPGLFEHYIRLREWKTRNEPQSFYPTPQSTPGCDTRGRKLDRSGGGRRCGDGSRRGNHMPVILTPESRWTHLSNSSSPATHPYYSSPCDRYRAPQSSRVGSSASSTPAKRDENRVPISNPPRAFGLEQ